MTAALCHILHPPSDVAIAPGLGALVGALIHVARGQQTLTVLVPVVSATIAAAISFEAVQPGVADRGCAPHRAAHHVASRWGADDGDRQMLGDQLVGGASAGFSARS